MKYQQGQVLLITIMLLATIVTVTLAVTLKSTTETQVTKLEEESQKALAAAEAGVEVALQRGTNIIAEEFLSLNIPAGFSGSATIATAADSDFVTPLLQQDQQYTLYLSTVNFAVSPPTFSNPYTGNLYVYFNSTDSSSCNNIALELTLIHSTSPYVVRRFVADKGDKIQGGGKLSVSHDGGGYGPFENQTFYCQTSLGSIGTYANAKILAIRSLFNQTKLGFVGNANLRIQGNTVTSEARSSTGVTKKVRLFQSYPQIPAEFFVTSF